MNTDSTSPGQLGPRDLTTALFAAALDGDPTADADLLALAVHDPTAQAAHEAIVVAELEARFRDDPLGGSLQSRSNRERHCAHRST